MPELTLIPPPTEKKLKPGVRCPDYHTVLQCSTECQNCRFNRFRSMSLQFCTPHSHTEAQRKGAPSVAPESYIRERLELIKQKELQNLQQNEN